MNFLLVNAGEFIKNNSVVILLIVALVAMLIMSYISSKKNNEARNQMANKLEKGVKVITQSGIYGTIESITETTDGKVVVISTGEGDKKSYMQIHINAIANIDNKRNIVLDENGVDITFKDEDDKQNKAKEVNAVATSDEQPQVNDTQEATVETTTEQQKTTAPKKVQGATSHKDENKTTVKRGRPKKNK